MANRLAVNSVVVNIFGPRTLEFELFEKHG